MTRPLVADWLPPALRDAPDGDGPRLLDALLDGVEQQRRLLEQDIDQVWDDLFIESCADWAVPYIGALLGLPGRRRRLEVAYAIALRRRKGTPAALEDFAEVLTDYTVRVLEGWQITRLGAASRPSAAAAGRLRSTSATARGSGSARRSSAGAGASRRPVRGRRARRRPSLWPWQVRTYLEVARRLAARAGAVRAPSARRRGAALPESAAAAAVERRRRVGRPVAHGRRARRAGPRDLPTSSRRSPAPARSSTGSTGRSAPTIRSRPAPGRPPRRC